VHLQKHRTDINRWDLETIGPKFQCGYCSGNQTQETLVAVPCDATVAADRSLRRSIDAKNTRGECYLHYSYDIDFTLVCLGTELVLNMEKAPYIFPRILFFYIDVIDNIFYLSFWPVMNVVPCMEIDFQTSKSLREWTL
jgi:hypothetical protein